MIKVNCDYCDKVIEKYPSQIKNSENSYCSLRCSGLAREPYERTKEHKERMSQLHKSNPKVKKNLEKAVEVAALNKKGKTYDEIYGKEKAEDLKKKISKIVKGEGNPNYGNGEKIMGEKNPNWKGGRSFEPYTKDFNSNLKERVRKRDEHKCVECGHHQDELDRKLDVHHIDYNKNNNNIDNLVSLCRSCHSQTNYQRDDWIKYFREKI